MKKAVFSIIIGVLILGGLVLLAWPNGKNDGGPSVKSNGALTVEGSDSYDFGSISMAAGNVKYQFKIKNTGSEAVIMSKLYTSCMCTTATLMMGDRRLGPFGMPGHGSAPSINQTINPNEEAAIEVVFDPAAHGPAGVGRIQRAVTLENNAGKPIELQFAATVTP